GYRVEYAIDVSRDGAAYQQVLASAFDGKTTQRYARSHRIELPAGASQGWNVRVRRLTANANSSTISDRTVVDAVTEVIDAKLRYPMSAVVGIKVDASQFQSVPTRAYDLKGRIIRVPSNYDPETRTYTGVWDGTFKLAWTDNPAWVFFDLVSNDRYGLGERVPA
ncbi:TipJ family phage tail tip protein, partial [Achromobacter xylosoxidans]